MGLNYNSFYRQFINKGRINEMIILSLILRYTYIIYYLAKTVPGINYSQTMVSAHSYA